MSFWEMQLLHLLDGMGKSVQDQSITDKALAELADLASKDIEELRKRNEEAMQKSLSSIQKATENHKNMMQMYTNHILNAMDKEDEA